MQGKLATLIDRIEHGRHVFRAYFKNAFLKQYEKFSTFLRNELVSNNLADFRLKKGLDDAAPPPLMIVSRRSKGPRHKRGRQPGSPRPRTGSSNPSLSSGESVANSICAKAALSMQCTCEREHRRTLGERDPN